jgi:hypothetical protein
VKPLVLSALFIAIPLSGSLAALPPPETSDKPIEFDREIRSILFDTCFSCHSPDEKLRLAWVTYA